MPPKRVKSHESELKVKQPNITCEEITSKCTCPHCLKLFATQSNLTRHINQGYCIGVSRNQVEILTNKLKALEEREKTIDSLVNTTNHLVNSVDKMEQSLKTIGESPISNNLNVMCLGSRDNLLDMLSLELGLPETLTLIKNCALSRSGGDCHILEKVYLLKDKRPALMYANKSKTQYVYYNEKNTRIVENNSEVIAKKLAGILQSTYSKGISFFETDLYGNVRDEETIKVESSDRDNWNSHIQELNETKYQKKVLKSLHIPFEKDVKIKYN
jgi:uncharacterized C2H2 Zn-finger protein